jgi:hypothetical protein
VLLGLVAIFLGSRAFGESIAWSLVGVVVVTFGVVASYHVRVKNSLRRHTIWLHIKTTHAARMTLDWARIPPSPAVPSDIGHAFANDLNLIGERSLHQLLDTAISRQGSARLRAWLLHPLTAPEQVRARQSLVRELMPLVMFRDRLTLHGALVAGPIRALGQEALRHWLEEPLCKLLFPWLLVLGMLAAANILGILYALSLLPAFWVSSFAVISCCTTTSTVGWALSSLRPFAWKRPCTSSGLSCCTWRRIPMAVPPILPACVRLFAIPSHGHRH